jgi:predicted phage-related endonuclease
MFWTTKINAVDLSKKRVDILSSFLKVEEDLNNLAQEQENYSKELERQIDALKDEQDHIEGENKLTQNLLKNFKKLLS